jgi:hypothetical protein
MLHRSIHTYIPQFCTKQVQIDFDGHEFSEKVYDLEIEFRNPWEVMKRWIRDETLAEVSTWFSQQRFLCLDGVIDFSNPLYDEPCTAETWRDVDVGSLFLSFLI